jgi:transcriptional regulator with XRE-family HTH domain
MSNGKKKAANSIDVYVGAKVRMRRLMLGLSQEQLGDKLNVTFQQVQKYEKGTNRIGASRLQVMAHALQVPVSFFFDGAPSEGRTSDRASDAASPNYMVGFLSTSEGLALAGAFMNIKNAKVRRALVHLVEAVSKK